jgi:hypothetical protein
MSDARGPSRPPVAIVAVWAALGALVVGAAAAWMIAADGLTLAHYDARGHLIVARRITDSLTPGYRQIGALWLPVPHVLNAIPVMWDVNYRTGASAVIINIVAMAVGLAALAAYVARRTGRAAPAFAAAAIVLLNPGVLFLTGTPMTEPLLFAFCFLALEACDRRLDAPESFHPIAQPGPWLALAALTRYEAWPVTAALTTLTAWSRGRHWMGTFARLAAWPAGAAFAFLMFGRLTLGRFFADADFFTPDNPALHRPVVALTEITQGFLDVAGWPVVLMAAAGAIVLIVAAWRERSARPLLPFGLAAAAVLPFTAFLDGHPYRVRYTIALAAASGPLIGALLARVQRRFVLAASLAAVVAAVAARPPLAADAPMTLEAQRERGTQRDRRAITSYLAEHYDGEPILISMNSLGHYMQELSAIGMPLRDFIHMGNGDLWAAAYAHPERHAGWVMIEEQAEGGDEIAQRVRENPAYLDAFERVVSGGGAVLFRRVRPGASRP